MATMAQRKGPALLAFVAIQILWLTHGFDKTCAVVDLVAASYMP